MNLSNEVIIALIDVINVMFKFRFLPGRSNQANVILIPKLGKKSIFSLKLSPHQFSIVSEEDR